MERASANLEAAGGVKPLDSVSDATCSDCTPEPQPYKNAQPTAPRRSFLTMD